MNNPRQNLIKCKKYENMYFNRSDYKTRKICLSSRCRILKDT